MNNDLMKVFVSEEAALSFGLALGICVLFSVFIPVIFGFIEIIFAKYKKKHDLK